MELKAKKRKIQGKKVRRLRREEKVPAILYGGEGKPQSLTLNRPEFEKVYQEAGESTLIDLCIDGKKEKVLISDVQHDPLGKLLHVDLQRVEAGEKLTATVAIEIEGESPVVKSGEGILLTLLDEVEVECLPQDLPPEIKVDIASLTEVGQGIEIKDLPIDKTRVKVLDHEPDELVLKIDYPKMEEEVVVAEEEAVAAVEAEKEKPEEKAEEAATTEVTEKKESTEKEGPRGKPSPEEKPKEEEKKR